MKDRRRNREEKIGSAGIPGSDHQPKHRARVAESTGARKTRLQKSGPGKGKRAHEKKKGDDPVHSGREKRTIRRETGLLGGPLKKTCTNGRSKTEKKLRLLGGEKFPLHWCIGEGEEKEKKKKGVAFVQPHQKRKRPEFLPF